VTEPNLRQQRLQSLQDELGELESQLHSSTFAEQDTPRIADSPVAHPSPPETSEGERRPAGRTLKQRIRTLVGFSALAVVCAALPLTLTQSDLHSGKGGGVSFKPDTALGAGLPSAPTSGPLVVAGANSAAQESAASGRTHGTMPKLFAKPMAQPSASPASAKAGERPDPASKASVLQTSVPARTAVPTRPPANGPVASPQNPAAAEPAGSPTSQGSAKQTPAPTPVPIYVAAVSRIESAMTQPAYSIPSKAAVQQQTPAPTSSELAARATVDQAPTSAAQAGATERSVRAVAPEAPANASGAMPGADSITNPSSIDNSLSPRLAGIVARYGIDPNGRFLIVDQDAQQLIVWDPGKPIRTLAVSTGGADGYITPAWSGRVGNYIGTIYTFGAFADDAWYLFESLGSILIHSVPYQVQGNSKTYDGISALGTAPISHGCIRLSPEDAHWLTEWNPFNVPLVILPMFANASATGDGQVATGD
jgi:hypothetical protein